MSFCFFLFVVFFPLLSNISRTTSTRLGSCACFDSRRCAEGSNLSSVFREAFSGLTYRFFFLSLRTGCSALLSFRPLFPVVAFLEISSIGVDII